jgi:hypothetical protein
MLLLRHTIDPQANVVTQITVGLAKEVETMKHRELLTVSVLCKMLALPLKSTQKEN